jgi:hypothetical protein
MRSELLSTRRPTRLRLIGFAAIVVGALLAGAGAVGTWAVIGFPAAIHGPELPVRGTDIWEGVVVLAAAVAAAVLAVVTYATRSPAARSGAGFAVGAIGVAIVSLTAVTLAIADGRFTQPDALGANLTPEAARFLVVDVRPAPWVALAGGVLILAGGVMRAWDSRAARATPRLDT